MAHRFEDADGAWTGFERGIDLPGGEVGQVVLTGEGAYEGLVAVLTGTPAEDGEVYYKGYIYEELPPLPEPAGSTSDG